tara:strand:- start:225 stop:452 length:228 start_codon:yes stop_codon:yes gene_type:complete
MVLLRQVLSVLLLMVILLLSVRFRDILQVKVVQTLQLQVDKVAAVVLEVLVDGQTRILIPHIKFLPEMVDLELSV